MNLGAETEQVEHKKSTSELKEGMQSIAAILNKHSAGELYFGVRDNGEVIGQQTGARTLRDVSQAITTSIEPRVYTTPLSRSCKPITIGPTSRSPSAATSVPTPAGGPTAYAWPTRT